MATITLAAKLNQYKWLFFEKGMMHVWNELKRLSNAANTTQLGSGLAFGTLDFQDNCNPDVAELVNDPNPVGYAGSNVFGTSPPTQAQS